MDKRERRNARRKVAMIAARRPLALAALAAAGIAAAFALTVAPSASAYSIGDLAALGYSVAHIVDSSPPPGVCPETYRITGYGSAITLETCDPSFSEKLDAFVRATCPCAQTTAATTTAAPPAGTTDTTTATQPPPPPPPATTTTLDPVVQAQIAALQAQIDQLRAELVSLVQILERWPRIDPGILAQLLALQGG